MSLLNRPRVPAIIIIYSNIFLNIDSFLRRNIEVELKMEVGIGCPIPKNSAGTW
jgi:hypothetical protein